MGDGEVGELAAQMDALKRRQREEEAQAWSEERERMNALDTPVEELCEISELLAHATFLLAGYHQHKRGEWRKRRDSRDR